VKNAHHTLGVSLAICCYNSRDRIGKTLAHVAVQECAEIPWEILLIDNASTDGTAEYVKELYPDALEGKIRIIQEKQQGLSYARLAAIREARLGIISFIDDDNWIPPSWIKNVEKLFQKYPKAGMIGGPSVPSFEISPPEWFYSIQSAYAVGRMYQKCGDITENQGALLWGAGMNVRTNAVKEVIKKGFSFLQSGRQAANLGAGEDSELCFAIRESGWRIRFEELLQITHFIPESRLSKSYALRMTEGMGSASILLELYLEELGRIKKTLLGSLAITCLVKDIIKTAIKLIKYLFDINKTFTDQLELAYLYSRVKTRLFLINKLCKIRNIIRKSQWRKRSSL
jgi:glycosyltransferase involved in cell wall biosynthesis